MTVEKIKRIIHIFNQLSMIHLSHLSVSITYIDSNLAGFEFVKRKAIKEI